jgi:hypothetical protein
MGTAYDLATEKDIYTRTRQKRFGPYQSTASGPSHDASFATYQKKLIAPQNVTSWHRLTMNGNPSLLCHRQGQQKVKSVDDVRVGLIRWYKEEKF